MNLSLLLQWWGFAGGDFLKPLAYFLPVHSAKKPCTWRNVVLKIPTKWDFSRFLGQAFDWLSAVNRAKTSLQVLLHLSPEKKGKLTGVLHADRLTWEAGDLFSLHVTLRLQGERERDQQGASRWEPGELAGVQHGVRLQKLLGPHLQKGQNPGKADFISF